MSDQLTTAARRVEATALARDGYEAIEVAFVAVKPEEAVGEDPSFEVRAELPLDEVGHRAIAFSLREQPQEGFDGLSSSVIDRALRGEP